jgi:outer membrane protein OmpA-like peptidoglycan-associated protein
MKPFRSLFLLFCILSNPALAGLQHYQAPLDAVVWETSAKKHYCSLSHDIPLYGRATFAQAAGESLGFTLSVKRKATRDQDRAHLRALPPAWMHQVAAVDLGEVPVHKGARPFQFDAALARRLLAELQQGMFPTLSYRDWADARDQVSVALPGIHIKQAMDEFVSCLARLPIYKFGDYQHSLLHFDSGKYALSDQARRRLDAVAKYLKTDPEVKRIEVHGHTDNVGSKRSNDRLAKRRSQAVEDYLMAKGVSTKLFSIKSFGERKPAAPNRSDKGRAQNRRVTVTLSK